MKVPHPWGGEEEGKMATRKQKAEARAHEAEKNKKAKPADAEGGKTVECTAREFQDFCKAVSEHLPVEDIRKLLETNDQEASGSDEDVLSRCQDMLFFGPLKKCPVCGHHIKYERSHYACRGPYSEWTTCTYTSRESPRKAEAVKVPEGVGSPMVAEEARPESVPSPGVDSPRQAFYGMMISLSGRLSRTHHVWREEIERHGGKVSNTISGVTCLVVPPSERERGGSSKLAEAMERNIPVVREAWLRDSIREQEAQPLDAYDVVSDLGQEALESLSAESGLQGLKAARKGGRILEREGIFFNCAFSICDQGKRLNEYCIMQLIALPDDRLYLYYKKGRVGDDPRAEERVEEKADVDCAIKEFARLFEEVTGNEFEPWEREKRFVKKSFKFYPIDMDDGYDVRYGGLGLRQYALMEMGLDSPDLPVGMVTGLHLKRCQQEDARVEDEAKMVWLDFSNKWFTLMHSTRPFTIRNYQELADYVAAALEAVRDITVASHLVGDMTRSTIDDPLSDCYKKLGFSVENIFAVESSGCPSYDEMKKLPNKMLLWCGTRSSNLLRHLHKGFFPAVCSLPVPGYMFGRAIVCSDAAAEAARYGFTAVDRREGFLVLAVVSFGEKMIDISALPEDTNGLEEKKTGVKGLGRKKTAAAEHTRWKDDVIVPGGRLLPSEHKDSPLEYNEYAVYDPKQVYPERVASSGEERTALPQSDLTTLFFPSQVAIRFLVAVNYEEMNVDYDTAE
ncbi:unnamed protein product [Spirodela intermedia]|uniref:Poly [ADP-ribose] polymerase n=1 Tax=Spirodela intermedia TaxID=51605 RepID=A0A7I8IRR8_SPIIN|nr:unnamed protein product [Spirodela intermedia]CAA6660681.1 unnamed protein product [Spirodela intermedia]